MAYLGCENVLIKVLKHCLQLAQKPWTIAEHSLFSIMSQTFTAERHMLQWQGNDLLQERAENLFKLHLIDQASLLNHCLDWSLTNFLLRFLDKLHNSPALILTKMLIWNKKDNVNCFFFCSLEPLLQITQDTKTNYVIIRLVWPRTKP